MPITADRTSLGSYAQCPAGLDRDWLGRVCHLSAADLAVIQRRTDPVTQLGYAAQLVTIRAIGTFQPDPAAVPEPVVAAAARHLGIDDPGVLAGYRDMLVRWRHTAEIRARPDRVRPRLHRPPVARHPGRLTARGGRHPDLRREDLDPRDARLRRGGHDRRARAQAARPRHRARGARRAAARRRHRATRTSARSTRSTVATGT